MDVMMYNGLIISSKSIQKHCIEMMQNLTV
jgi:hypothetical protein